MAVEGLDDRVQAARSVPLRPQPRQQHAGGDAAARAEGERRDVAPRRAGQRKHRAARAAEHHLQRAVAVDVAEGRRLFWQCTTPWSLVRNALKVVGDTSKAPYPETPKKSDVAQASACTAPLALPSTTSSAPSPLMSPNVCAWFGAAPTAELGGGLGTPFQP